MAIATMPINTAGVTAPAAGRILARPSTSLAPRIVILGVGLQASRLRSNWLAAARGSFPCM